MKSGTPTSEIVFSDKQMFTAEARFNPQNDRMLARHSEDILENMLTVYRRQKPASVMVWAAVSKTRKFPLIFAKEGIKVNTNARCTFPLPGSKIIFYIFREHFNKLQ